MQRVRPENLKKRFVELEKAGAIAEAMFSESSVDPEQTVEDVIYEGYNTLIREFNNTCDDRIFALAPAVAILKASIGGDSAHLPEIHELGKKDLVQGYREARTRMLEGQRNKELKAQGVGVLKSVIDHAIGAPSVNTTPEALAVGSAGHILERTIMAHFSALGIDTSDWPKDHILWALEEMALLTQARATTYGQDIEPLLLSYFIGEPSETERNAGMGWRTIHDAERMVDAYQEAETRDKQQLIYACQDLLGDELELDIAEMPYEEALAYVYPLLEDAVEDVDEFLEGRVGSM
jgi:hypothetical protein